MATFFRWLSHCPLGLLHALGGLLGWLSFLASATYRRRFLANARQAGVPWRQARCAVAEAGRMLAELPYLWMRPVGQDLGGRLRMEGLEHIEAAHAQGRGIVFLSPHLGSFEVAAQSYAERYHATREVTVLYRPARKAWLREVVDTARARPGLSTAPATLAGVRQMVRVLRQGGAVGLLPDQVPPEGMGVWAPFFGRPAYTMTLAARLVQQTGAAVLLVWCERLRRGRGYVAHFEAMDDALPPDPAAREESAAAINRAMEQLVLRCPQQYLWGYHRYKTPAAHAPAKD